MRGAVTSQSAAAEAGRARRVAKVRAEMIFDIDDSLVERAFDGSHVDRLPERLLVRCDDDHECHLLQRVIPLTLIERSDDEPARSAAITLKSCWNTPGIAC